MKTILVDAVNTFVVKTEDGGYEIFEPLRTLLEQLPNKKIILTGANDEQIKKFGLDKMPYEVFTLKHEPEKTDPQYYESMLKNFSLEASEVVYFEHNSSAVASAESVGIKTFFWNKDVRPLGELQNFFQEHLESENSEGEDGFAGITKL